MGYHNNTEILVRGKKGLASTFKFWSAAPLRYLDKERYLGRIDSSERLRAHDKFKNVPENRYYYVSDKNQVYNLRNIDERSPFIDGLDDTDITKLFLKISSGVKKDLIPPAAVAGVSGAGTIFSCIAAVVTNAGYKSAKSATIDSEVEICTKVKEELKKKGLELNNNDVKFLVTQYKEAVKQGSEPNDDIEEELDNYKSLKREQRAIWCMDRAVKGGLILGVIELVAIIVVLSFGITLPTNPFASSVGLTEAILGGIISITGVLMLIPALIALAGQMQMCYQKHREAKNGKEEVVEEKEKSDSYKNYTNNIIKNECLRGDIKSGFARDTAKFGKYLDDKVEAEKQGVTISSRISISQAIMAIGSILTITAGILFLLNLTGIITIASSFPIGFGIAGGVLSFLGGVGTVIYSVKNSFQEIDDEKKFELKKHHSIAIEHMDLFNDRGMLDEEEYKKLKSYINDYQDKRSTYTNLYKLYDNSWVSNDLSLNSDYFIKSMLHGYKGGDVREIFTLDIGNIFRRLDKVENRFLDKVYDSLGITQGGSVREKLMNIIVDKYSAVENEEDKESLLEMEWGVFIELFSDHHINKKESINHAFNHALRDWLKITAKDVAPELLLNQIMLSKVVGAKDIANDNIAQPSHLLSKVQNEERSKTFVEKYSQNNDHHYFR